MADEDEDDQTLAPRSAEVPPASPNQTRPHPPGVVAIGHRDGEEVTLDLPATGGLALTGPGAPAAVRALVVSALASGPQHAVEVVVAGADLADTLLPALPTVPGLTVAHDLDGALRRVEVELLERTRLLDDADVTTLAEFTASNPAEPLPLLVLVAETPPPILAGRLAAVLHAGRSLGIGAVMLGEAPGTAALTVNADGDVDADDHELPAPLQPLTTARLFTFDPAQAHETLQLLATSRGERPPPPPSLQDTAAVPSSISQPVADASDTQTTDVPPSPALQPTPVPDISARGAGSEPPIQVRALGPIRIEAGGTEVNTGLRAKARELLALLLIHPDGIAAELAIETLWPDAPPPRGAERLQTVLSNLRTTLKTAAGLEDRQRIVTYAGRQYTIDANLIDCDLWRFQAALATAARATDPAALATALSQAVTAYNGSFAEGERLEWVEAPREDLRRRAINAATRLAELHQRAGQLDPALAALEQAITWDPHVEELYRRIMRLQAALHRPDAVQRTFDQLVTQLDNLDEEPDDATRQLLNELLNQARL